MGADVPTVDPLLESFTAKGGGSAAEAKAATGLLNGVITDAYLPPEGEASNPWIQTTKKLLEKYAPGLWAKTGLDANSEYGVALAHTFVLALRSAGKDLTRQGLMKALADGAHHFVTPGLVPLSYSSSVHYGYEGAQVVQLSSSATPVVTPSGSWPGVTALTPVYTTSPAKGPIKAYQGGQKSPPEELLNTA